MSTPRGSYIDQGKGRPLPLGFLEVVEVWNGRGVDVRVTRTGVRFDKNKLRAYHKKTTREGGGQSVLAP